MQANNIFKYLTFYIQQAGKLTFLTLFFIILTSALFEIIGIGLLAPLLSEEIDIDILNNIFNYFQFRPNFQEKLVFIILVFFLKFIVLIFQTRFLFNNVYKILFEIRKYLFEKTFLLPFERISSMEDDKLSNDILKESEKVSLGLKYIVESLSATVYCLAYLFFTITIDYRIFSTSILIGFIFISLMKLITIKLKKNSIDTTYWNQVQNKFVINSLQNIKYLIATHNFPAVTRQYNLVNAKLKYLSTDTSFKLILSRIVTEPISVLIVALILYINFTYQFTNTQEAIVICFLFHKAFSKISAANQRWNDFNSIRGSVDNFLKSQENIDHYIQCANSSLSIHINKIKSISISNLTYSSNGKVLLKDISETFNENFICIIGQSGSGKTSLLNVLTSLYLSDKAFINKVPITKIDSIKYRQKIGYVSQDNVIFNDTLENNLTLWKEFKRSEVLETLKLVGLDSFLKKHPLDKVIVQSGKSISGGEKQRIAIARELLKKPEILFLDEATSALDQEAEKAIWSLLKKISKEIKIISISHRYEMLSHADKVILLKGGKILFSGKFSEIKEIQAFKRLVKEDEFKAKT